MNYRHGYHAGNFADVIKHIALVAILLYMRKKDTALSVVDSHAGRGLYDLSATQAGKTGEAAAGIGRLRDLDGDMPEALATYLAFTKQRAGWYPGSPLIAAMMLRPQDRLTAIEKHPEEFAALEQTLAPYAAARAESGDGYTRLVKLLPPPSRRGLVIVDPPFEDTAEFTRLGQAMRDAVRKFATGTYLVWYPIKSQAEANSFTGEILAAGVQKALLVEAEIPAPEGKLARTGLLVINPPFGFEGVIRTSAALVGPRLQMAVVTHWLAGAE